MIKRLIFAGVVAASLGSAPAMAQSHSATEIAAGLQGMVGGDFGNGVKLTGVAAEENNTLVLTLDGQQGWNSLTPELISQLFMRGFCGDPDGAEFVKTGWVRIDTLDQGKDLKRGIASNTCPAADATSK